MRSRIVGSMIAATILIGGYAATVTPPPGEASSWNIFVSSSGSNAATDCKRFSPAQADPGTTVCLTFAKACSLAQPGDNILVRNDGNYAQQSFANTDCPNAASSAQITFWGKHSASTPTIGAASDAPYVGGACTTDCGDQLRLPGDADSGLTTAPNYVTLYNFRVAGSVAAEGNQSATVAGTRGVGLVFDHIDTGSIGMEGLNNVLFDHSIMHDCNVNHVPRCGSSQSNDFYNGGAVVPGGGRPQNSGTIDHSIFHDYQATNASHGECLFLADWSTFTVQNSWFYNCTVSGAIRIERIQDVPSGGQLTIQNNWFGYMGSEVFSDHRCGAINMGSNNFLPSHILFRYNTFAAEQGILYGSNGLSTATTRFIGNMFGIAGSDMTDGGSDCETAGDPSGAVFDYNYWVGDDRGSHSTHAANLSAYNALLQNSATSGSGDYHLQGGAPSPPKDSVVCTSGDALLTVDRDGDARSSPCSAGSDE